jgi:hypothetical protein
VCPNIGQLGAAEREDQWIVGNVRYHPMLRFRLVDDLQRRFASDRWCFRGGMEGWHSLMGAAGPLEQQVAAYVPHVNKESFFELM